MKEENRYSIRTHLHKTACLILLFVFVFPVIAWSNPFSIDDPDGMFFRARELAFEEQYEEAKEICRQILEKYPDYHDVKILKARINSWQGNFVIANDLLREVLQKEPDNREALHTLIDAQMWYGDYEEAIKYLDIALNHDPNNTHLLFRKALALKETGDDLAAVVIINQILDLDPTYTEAKELLDTIETNRMVNHVGFGYQGVYFWEDITDEFGDAIDSPDPWHLFFLEYGRRTRSLGPVAIRANYARRYEIDSYQIEAEAYPTVRQGTYLYLNIGYSQDRKLFPMTRFGFEVHQALPAKWEASLGFRMLNFDEKEAVINTKDLLIITGSISKYYRQYYFSLRPYFTFSSVGDDPHSQSLLLTMRRFFTSPDHHLSLVLARGFSADMDKIAGGQIYDLSGTNVEVRLLYQQRLTNRFLFKVGAGYKFYEDDALWGNPYILEGALNYRF